MPLSKASHTSRIVSINIPDETSVMHAVLSTRDRDIALKDLIENSRFQPVNDQNGPYHIDLSIQENRLILAIKNQKKEALPVFILSLRPYKRLIQDYFLIVQSYDEAIKDGKPSRIEAIDMGRRGLHNEGADLLTERLSDKITMDFDTARRLFTLICVLHESKALLWR
jgi:uncharacterized protein (UPF0262 family)